MTHSHQPQVTYIIKRMYHICAATGHPHPSTQCFACLQSRHQRNMRCAMYVDVSKAKSASIVEIFKNSDLHEVFKLQNDQKRSHTPKKSIGEGKVPTYFWEVINM